MPETKFIFDSDENGDETTNQIACTAPASLDDVNYLLAQPAEDLDGRSGWTWVRFKDGTLMLAVYPSGDTYTHLSDKGVLDWRWQAEVEEPAPTKAWSSGWNIPGYLPDDEPMNCATWQEACDALADALGQATETGEEEMFLDYSNALKELSMAKRDTDWSIRIGNYVWWVQHIVLPEYTGQMTVR